MSYWLNEHKVLLGVVGTLWAAVGGYSVHRLSSRGDWRDLGDGLVALRDLLFKFTCWPLLLVYGGYLVWEQANQDKPWLQWAKYYVRRFFGKYNHHTRTSLSPPFYWNQPGLRKKSKATMPHVRKIQANMLRYVRRRWQYQAEIDFLNDKGNPYNYPFY